MHAPMSSCLSPECLVSPSVSLRSSFVPVFFVEIPSGTLDISRLYAFPLPRRQDTRFAFDRILEIVRIGVRVYGIDLMFPDQSKPSAKAAMRMLSPYSMMGTAMLASNPYSAGMEPGVGVRAWPMLGVYSNRSTGSRLSTLFSLS